jgi:hypothetical protein
LIGGHGRSAKRDPELPPQLEIRWFKSRVLKEMVVSPQPRPWSFSSPDGEPDIDAEKYESLRRKITKLLCWKGCPESRADALADETLDRIGEKPAQGEPIRRFRGLAIETASGRERKRGALNIRLCFERVSIGRGSEGSQTLATDTRQ